MPIYLKEAFEQSKTKIAFRMIIIFVIICAIFTNTNIVYADSLSDYQKELQEIKNQIQANSSALTGIQKEIANDMYDLVDLDAKVSEYTEKLNDAQNKIDEVNAKLEAQETALQSASLSYTAAEELYVTRLKVLYENGYPGFLDILFSSKSISDFFSRINVYDAILEYDKTMVKNMGSQKEYINNVKENIELEKAQLEQLKYDYEKSKATLQSAVDAKQAKIQSLENQKNELSEKGSLLEKQEQEAKDKITQELLSLANSGSNYAGVYTNEFLWPVPNNYIITALFDEKEYRVVAGMIHTGTDFGVSTGTQVVAMAAGKVVRAGYNAGGYGYYVVIDHGTSSDGYTYYSLYGHNSVLKVSVGELVYGGQLIALSGSTGNSTGPHLHVEINRAKGGVMYSIDPMQFFVGSVGIKYKLNGKYVEYPWNNLSAYQYSQSVRRSYSY